MVSVSLCQASVVSKDWYHAASQPNLWKRFCKYVIHTLCTHVRIFTLIIIIRVEKWKLSISGELKYQSKFLNTDGSIRVSVLCIIPFEILQVVHNNDDS